MNKFYNQHPFLQWFFAIILMIMGFLPALFIIELGFYNSLFYFLFFFYLPVGQFSLTPIFKLLGIYTYYSPMLLGYMANNVLIDLHSGTSFDYLFVMSKYPKVKYKNKILEFHLIGLLSIIEKIENGKIPSAVQVSATSYFFNERTIKKIGFNINTPSVYYRINLLVNFIDIFWMYSLAKGKITIPKVWLAKKGTISGAKLVARKEFFLSILSELKKSENI